MHRVRFRSAFAGIVDSDIGFGLVPRQAAAATRPQGSCQPSSKNGAYLAVMPVDDLGVVGAVPGDFGDEVGEPVVKGCGCFP